MRKHAAHSIIIVMKNKRSVLLEGMRDGIPIALGYFAVSFSLGIAMRNAGITSIEGFFFSMFNLASAGEYAGLQVILANGSYLSMAIATLVANARYLLMSTALSQRFDQHTHFLHRLITGYGITDEIFGITINRKDSVNPWYVYGALFISVPAWSIGTSLGIIAGNGLPANIVNALSVALYGMFIAIIVPPSRKDKAVAIAVIFAFVLSGLSSYLPLLSTMDSSTKTIVLTIVIASIAAILKPHQEDVQ